MSLCARIVQCYRKPLWLIEETVVKSKGSVVKPVPHISVVIPTYNAPEDVRQGLQSMSQIVYPKWDILVVDQSDDAGTRMVVDEYARQLPDLRYFHLADRGTCRARNLGIHETMGDIVTFIDDDCTVENSDWLEQIAAAFARNPEADVLFGSVKPAPTDWQQGVIPGYIATREFVVRGKHASSYVSRIDAAMYLKRDAAPRAGLFDPMLGPGSGTFPAAEDEDYRYCCLASGCVVGETPSIAVVHHAARSYSGGDASRLIRGYAYAEGGMHMKLLRCGDPYALLLIFRRVWLYLSLIDCSRLVRGQNATGVGRVAAYFRGLIASFRLRVDRERCVYIPSR